MTTLCDPSVVDDDEFNASLDELLRDANCYDALATTTTTTTTTNVGTTIKGVGVGVGIGHHQQQQQQQSWNGPTIRGQSAMNLSTTTDSTFHPPPSLDNNALSMLNYTWQTTQGVGNVVPGPLLQCAVVNTSHPEQQFQTITGSTTTPIIPQSCQSLGHSCYSGIETRMINGDPLPTSPLQNQQPCSEVDEPKSRRSRQSERNRREQERSHKITECITELRSVLSEAGVNFKPDRYSTLVSVANYVKALQVRSANLDEEHKRLLDSVVEQTEDGVSADVKQPQTTRDLDYDTITGAATTNTNASCDSSSSGDDEILKFVHGIDYRKIFTNSAIALAVASVDGRFVDCNDEFLHLTDYTREELLGDGPRRKSVLSHPQNSSIPPSESLATKKAGISTRSSGAPTVTVSTTTVKSSELMDATTTTKKTESKENRFIVVGDLEGATTRPPPEIHVRKHQHLSLFNLLGCEDMETVYAAMSRMLRASDEMSYVFKSSFDLIESSGTDSGGGGTLSSAEDSISKSAFTRSAADDLSSRMEVSNVEDAGGADENNMNAASSKNTTEDHWTGQVKHTRRMDHVLQLHVLLVRDMDGRPKFFNCALSEVGEDKVRS